MQPMTGHERIANILQRKPVDRIGLFEHFWSDTQRIWQANGWIPDETPFEDVFGFDLQTFWAFNLVADLDFGEEIVEETAETVLKRDGNGALLRRHKLHDSTPEHVDFLVKEREVPMFKQGDLMAFTSAGAYGFAMSSSYNSRPRVAEVMIKGDKYEIIRERETIEDLLKGEKIASFL